MWPLRSKRRARSIPMAQAARRSRRAPLASPARGRRARYRRRSEQIIRALSLALGGMLLAATIYGLVLGGFLNRGSEALLGLADTVTAAVGFSLDQVLVTGRHQTSPDALLAALQVKRGQSLLLVDCQAARERLLKLDWVSDAQVHRVLPGTLYVRVVERRPLAVWQHEGRLMLIDEQGHPIKAVGASDLDRYPHVVGAGAETSAGELFRTLTRFPEIESHVRAAVRVGGRRWNLVLDNGVTVALPAEDMEAALLELKRLDRDFSLLSREVTLIDLRFKDRWIIRVPSGGANAIRGPSRET